MSLGAIAPLPVGFAGVLLVVETGVLSLSLSVVLDGVAGTFNGSAEDDIRVSESSACG